MDDTRWLEREQEEAWRLLMSLVHLLPARLEPPLQASGLSLFEYMVLAMLSDAPERALAMGHLAQLTSSSPSRLSHAAARLESRGWIARSPDPCDGRVTRARLTDDGFDTLRDAAPAHVESVRELVFDGLDDDQVTQLRGICSVVLERIAPDLAPPWAPGDPRAFR